MASKKAVLIDTGINTPNAKELAEGLTDLPIILVNTHADPDHISGNSSFEELYAMHGSIPVKPDLVGKLIEGAVQKKNLIKAAAYPGIIACLTKLRIAQHASLFYSIVLSFVIYLYRIFARIQVGNNRKIQEKQDQNPWTKYKDFANWRKEAIITVSSLILTSCL